MGEGLAQRLGLRVRVLLFFALLGFGACAVVAAGLWVAAGRMGPGADLSGLVLAGLIAVAGILGLTLWIWLLFDEHVARPILQIAGGLRARVHAGVDRELDAAAARYLGDLGAAAQAVTGGLADTRNALAEAVERETTRLAEENARLEAILADVPAGVVLCNAEHQIVFYNGPAQVLLTGAQTGPTLHRSLGETLPGDTLEMALLRLEACEDPDAQTRLACATADGRMLDARMRLVALGGAKAGYVLILRDMTRDLALHGAREALLDEVFDKVRRRGANLRTMIGAGVTQTPQGAAALTSEADALAATLVDLGHRFDGERGRWWPMAPVPGQELVAAVSTMALADGVDLSGRSEAIFVEIDAVQMGAVLAQMVRMLAGAQSATDLSVAVETDGAEAMVTLGWRGAVLAQGHLEAWLQAPVEGLRAPRSGDTDGAVTGARVLALHGTTMWPEAGADGTALLRLPLRRTVADTPERRAAVHDFRLLEARAGQGLAATPLRELAYVVFDTETTGLLPSAGDEIVQLAALRMVGARRVPGEVYDTFVDPKRRIPAASTEVHGVTEAMVAGAPDIAAVGATFHHFAEGAVIVAHNAPFDMAFLRKHRREIGKDFTNPVIDTVLMSAVIFGQQEVHTLDALTERLGITIPEEARHTAMGDTIATAEALEKMIPMAEGMGIVTFGDLLAEMRRHSRLLEDLNAEPA